MIAITGANGQLGRLVVEALLRTVPASGLVAAVRSPEKARDLAARGVHVRPADYDRPETLGPALVGVEKLLLISGNEVGRRAAQHRAVIDAAKQAGVKLIAYTSLLRADRSALMLAEEHRETEAHLRASGVPFVLLRNGWYNENWLPGLPAALQHKALLGSAGEGRFAAAARADYAEAAAAVLTAEADQAGKVYELAGDTAFTLAELAGEIAQRSGEPVVYQHLPEAALRDVLVGAGLPEPLAAALAQSDAAAAEGALYDDGGQLAELLGRPTTRMTETLALALAR